MFKHFQGVDEKEMLHTRFIRLGAQSKIDCRSDEEDSNHVIAQSHEIEIEEVFEVFTKIDSEAFKYQYLYLNHYLLPMGEQAEK